MTEEKLKAWRSRFGLSQAELAETLGVRLNTVSRWEIGESAIPPYLDLALAELERRLLLDPKKKKRIKSK